MDWAVQATMVYGQKRSTKIHVLFVIFYRIYGLKEQLLFNYINKLFH